MEQRAKIIETNAKTVYELFSNSKGYFYVPIYQRPYSWTDDQIDKFWEDVNGAMDVPMESYFLGPIILVRTLEGMEIVDGQQRLTTLTIFFCTVRDLYEDKLTDDKLLLKKIRNSVFSLDEDRQRLKLRTKVSSENQFEQEIVYKVKFEELDKNGARASKFLKAAGFFRDKLKDLEGSKGIEGLENLVKYVMEKIELITIECPETPFAIKLFQVINTRGLDLNSSDLIRSELILNTSGENRKKFESTWHEIETIAKQMDIFGESEDAMTELLTYYQYYIIAKNPRSSLYEVLKKEFDKLDPNEVVYKFWLFVQSFDEILEMDKKEIYALRYLPNQVYWRSIMTTAKYTGYDQFDELCRVIRRLYYSYWIAGFTTSKVKQISYEIIQMLKEKKKIEEINKKIQEKFDGDRIDRSIKEALDSDAYSKPWLKPLLILVEYGLTDNSKLEFIQLNRKLTIDHILPQGWNNDQGWSGSWNQNDANQLLNKIENLTLLSELKNKSLQEMSFEEKKKVYKGEDGRGITAFNMSTLVAKNVVWGPSELHKRKEWIMERIKFEDLISI